MTIRKYLLAGILAVAGAVATGDRASAQVTIGPAGVGVTTRAGNTVVIPYNSGSGLTLATPNMAINTVSGTVYPSIYRGQNGTTTYLNPATGSFYNPVVGEFNTSPFAYPGTIVNQQPAVRPYPPGGYYYSAPVQYAPVVRPATVVPVQRR